MKRIPAWLLYQLADDSPAMGLMTFEEKLAFILPLLPDEPDSDEQVPEEPAKEAK